MAEENKKTVEELEKELETLRAENAQKDDALKAAHESLSDKDASGTSRPEITIGKTKYAVVGTPFSIKTEEGPKKVTLEDLKKDKDLQKKLVDAGSGVLIKLSDLKVEKKKD